MVNKNGSGRTKRRKSVAYKTPRERQRLNSTNSRVTAPKAIDNDKRRRTNSDSSVASNISTLKTFETEQVDSAKRDSLSTASVSKVPEPQTDGTKSPGKRVRQPSKQNDKKSGKSQVTNSPKKRKISEKANDKAENSNNLETSNTVKKKPRKHRKSINFTTARERKRRVSRHQSENEIDPNSSNQTSTLTGKRSQSASQLNVSEFQASQRDKENSLRKSSTKSTGQKSNSSLKTAKTRKINENSIKAAQTRKKDSDKSSSSETTMTKMTGTKTKQRKNETIPDRIKNILVTEKAFSRWKPLANSTKEFVEQTLKSVMLNVIVDTSANENPETTKHLKLLKDRVLERLPCLKAPYTQGDYRKMESQNRESEEALLAKSRELNALDRKLEEEGRLLEAESEMVEEYKKKLERCKIKLSSLDHGKAHPLLRGTENVLDLPELPEEFFNDDDKEVPLPLEADSVEEKHLAQTLSKLREKAGSVGLIRWMNRLGRLAEELEKE